MITESEKLNIKVMQVHKIALRNLSRLQGEPMSVVLRGLIRDEAQRCGVWPADSHSFTPTPSQDIQGATNDD